MPTPLPRHYGLDWLRIAAFALLIVYHVAMVFAPWHWVIKAPATHDWLIVPMALSTPWRLPLLFVVSGFASRRLLDRGGSLRGFVRSRNLRLLMPWAFAMVALLPPELWVRARLNGYPSGFLHFWLRDYWSLTPVAGVSFPSWEHLWFVAYLWAYTMILALWLRLAGPACAERQCASLTRWLAEGRRLVWTPIAALVVVKLSLLFVVPEGQGLTTDWSGHAQYLPLFGLGFVIGGTSLLWEAMARGARASGVIAVMAGATVLAIELHWRGEAVPPHAMMALDRAARLAMAWSVVLLALRFADRHWNRDRRWRATLGEAVFPFYLVHHPAIVVIAWAVLPLGWPPAFAFAAILAGTAAICVIFYAAGREIGWLRPLIGLGPRRHARSAGVPPMVIQPTASGVPSAGNAASS